MVKAMLRDPTTKMLIRAAAGAPCGCISCADCPHIASWTVSFSGIDYSCAASCLPGGFYTPNGGTQSPVKQQFSLSFNPNDTVTISLTPSFGRTCVWTYTQADVGTVTVPCDSGGITLSVSATWTLIRSLDTTPSSWSLQFSLSYSFTDGSGNRYTGGMILFEGRIDGGVCPDDLTFTNLDSPGSSGTNCIGTGGTAVATPDA